MVGGFIAFVVKNYYTYWLVLHLWSIFLSFYGWHYIYVFYYIYGPGDTRLVRGMSQTLFYHY